MKNAQIIFNYNFLVHGAYGYADDSTRIGRCVVP